MIWHYLCDSLVFYINLFLLTSLGGWNTRSEVSTSASKQISWHSQGQRYAPTVSCNLTNFSAAFTISANSTIQRGTWSGDAPENVHVVVEAEDGLQVGVRVRLRLGGHQLRSKDDTAKF